jgi:hypothetical protein
MLYVLPTYTLYVLSTGCSSKCTFNCRMLVLRVCDWRSCKFNLCNSDKSTRIHLCNSDKVLVFHVLFCFARTRTFIRKLQPLHSKLHPLHSKLHPLHSKLQPLHSKRHPLHSKRHPLQLQLHPLYIRNVTLSAVATSPSLHSKRHPLYSCNFTLSTFETSTSLHSKLHPLYIRNFTLYIRNFTLYIRNFNLSTFETVRDCRTRNRNRPWNGKESVLPCKSAGRLAHLPGTTLRE